MKSFSKICRSRQSYIHTYIIGHYNLTFSQDYGLACHTTHVGYVNFIREWRNLQFNMNCEDRFLKNFFMAGLFTVYSFCQKSAKRKSLKKYFFQISVLCLTWNTNPEFTSNKPTHYLLDYGGFMHA